MRLVCFCLPWDTGGDKQRRLRAAAPPSAPDSAGGGREGGDTYVDGHDGQVDVVEELVVEFDGHAGGEEDHQLLLPVLLEEGEEQQEPLL